MNNKIWLALAFMSVVMVLSMLCILKFVSLGVSDTWTALAFVSLFGHIVFFAGAGITLAMFVEG